MQNRSARTPPVAAVFPPPHTAGANLLTALAHMLMPAPHPPATAEADAIHWASCDTRLGPLLMAATERGVCFAQFGASEAALVAELQREFPKAQWRAAQAHPQVDAWMSALESHLDHAAPLPAVPLDLRGTAFQLRVWHFLQGVPLGTTRSYAEVAAGIGSPTATRAVGTACGANRVAVLVPCHRVLRGDGGLGGYRWGVERKQTLLRNETRAT